ncbi:MAG TPA: hypothetical protein VFB79_22140, partial [Candidatus Angelobacter sp.]|nr:hypothetical protein [Candidatus Angelobacter sp.]
MHKAAKTAVLFVMICLGLTEFPAAQSVEHSRTKSAMDDVITTLFSAKGFAQTSVSPDGKQVAWVENENGNEAIHVSSVNGGNPQRITAGGMTEGAVAWSPDSKQIAFFSDARDGQQLYVVNASGGKARKLTSVKGFIASPG